MKLSLTRRRLAKPPSAQSSAATPPGDAPRPLAQRLAEGFLGLLSVLLPAAALGGIITAYNPLLARASALSSRPVAVSFAWPLIDGTDQTWLDPRTRGELERLVLDIVTPDWSDAASLHAAQTALAGTGWFAGVPRLERLGRRALPDGSVVGLVRVGGRFRVPVAAVRHDGRDQLVTADGVLLPLAYRAGDVPMRVIVGVTHDAPEPGQPWPGGQVQAGLALLQYLRDLPGWSQVEGIDVSDFSARRSLSIITDRGNVILWGGAVDQFNPGQPPALTKAQRLVQVYTNFGRIDAGRPVLDLRLETHVDIVDAWAAIGGPPTTGSNMPARVAAGERRR